MPLVDLVAGARPNFLKLAALVRAFGADAGGGAGSDVALRIVHTRQHRDAAMSEVFFAELELPAPDVFLGGGGEGPRGRRVARILEAYEDLLLREPCDLCVVLGDVDGTLASALAATQTGVPVAHVEAGLRSFDRRMPEEVNRVLVDHLARLWLVTETAGVANLAREGIAGEAVHLVGPTQLDVLAAERERARARRSFAPLGLEARGYALVTLHRAATVDDPEILRPLFEALRGLAADRPLVFPVHPRTRARLEAAGLPHEGVLDGRLHLLSPLAYLDLVSLLDAACVVLTDSGGLQLEAAFLGTPCLTLRDATEHRATVEAGLNRIVGTAPEAIAAAWDEVLAGPRAPATALPLADGRAGARCVAALRDFLARGPGRDAVGREGPAR